jgi:micrococcal nuclease
MTYKKVTATLVVATICIIGMFGALGYYIVHAATTVSIDENTPYLVTHVMDGDTFMVKVGRHEVTVRMLGIDTPETVDPRKTVQCYGKEASDHSKYVLSGKNVQLKLNPDRKEKDKYGRYLAYVYLGEKFVNESLLEDGFAREYTFGKPYMYQKEFRELEKVAKEEKRGMWGACDGADNFGKKR